ncbi:hypothetical protein [Microbacterium sp. RURRCA19A]|uniref:hypothetical protein n=1 Tax=Microbacterium sp. RURRCA19A TaxID=1907391 RepID=UPI0009573749|nr:hypothetical protein [Microbacterium sp. RURRCA19A]SIS19720.1 hypothetical protein SAMN05880568_3474 [Microbacterium sp. RURRCA19A]
MITTAGLYEFASRCAVVGVDVPEALRRGLELIQVANEHAEMPGPDDVLALSDEQLRERVEAISIRWHVTEGLGGNGLKVGQLKVTDELTQAIAREVVPELDSIVESLQPRFDELAAPLVAAAREYGFTFDTTSDDVIELVDEGAATAWRAVRRAWSALAPLVTFRTSMSKLFDLGPTMDDVRAHFFPRSPGMTTPNFSVLFAAGDNWSIATGYYVEGKTRGHLDWLALARDGIQLNTPTVVEAKLNSRRQVRLPAPEATSQPLGVRRAVRAGQAYPSVPSD